MIFALYVARTIIISGIFGLHDLSVYIPISTIYAEKISHTLFAFSPRVIHHARIASRLVVVAR